MDGGLGGWVDIFFFFSWGGRGRGITFLVLLWLLWFVGDVGMLLMLKLLELLWVD